MKNIKSIVKLLALIALAIYVSQANAHRSGFDRIVSFGASLSDSGNSYYWLSLPENKTCGIPVTKPPYVTLDGLVPNGPYAISGNRFTYSNGPTWLENFARYLALAPSTKPAFSSVNKKFTNYAVGGARAIANYPCRVNLPQQIQNYFVDYRRTSPNTLITLEIGGNDIRDALIAAAVLQQDPMPYLVNAISSINDALYSLYQHGARKFLVLNVPDLGKTPAVRQLPIPEAIGAANQLTKLFNESLLVVLKANQKLAGNKIKLLDIKAKLDDVVSHGEAYGFTNTTGACIKPNQPPYQCSNPDSYVFWDGIHPTEALHEIVAQQAMSVMSKR
jgi:phospholipase/lecithinase/hemolysin